MGDRNENAVASTSRSEQPVEWPRAVRRSTTYHTDGAATWNLARSRSPVPSISSFSFIGADEADSSEPSYHYRTPYKTGTFGRRTGTHSTPTLNYLSPSPNRNPSYTYNLPSFNLRSLLPKLWDVLSSPTRQMSDQRGLGFSSLSPSKKGKGKQYQDPFEYNDMDYSTLPPLDDDEGELIDDEACFVTVDFLGIDISDRVSRARRVTGIDILALLPPELSLYILTLLCAEPAYSHTLTGSVLPQDNPLQTLLTCRQVSKTWFRLSNDNIVWRALYKSRWGPVDEATLNEYVSRQRQNYLRTRFAHHVSRNRHKSDLMALSHDESSHKFARRSMLGERLTDFRIKNGDSSAVVDSRASLLPSTVKWELVYQERLRLHRRWSGTSREEVTSPYPALSPRPSDGYTRRWEPEVTRLTGHHDSVYCLELTSQYIITGSRDRTIRMWSFKTGRCLGTFGKASSPPGVDGIQGHDGSVLCLKFLWLGPSLADGEFDSKCRGVLFSGSSDRTVFVWDLVETSKRLPRRRQGGLISRDSYIPDEDDCEREVEGKVSRVLRGHSGGVLDLRVDDRRIVTCSKDTAIRVWDRQSGELLRTLEGHEGPVNALGLEGDRVVSASGDGKIVLWNLQNGERIMTFEGHERGLACVDLKDGLVVSGSNDCKIKIWNATTGACLRTLVGHEMLVRALSFDPRNGRLVSASYDRSVRVWDIASGKTIREFRNTHSSQIFDVKFDVRRIVSTSHDRSVVIVDFSKDIESSALFI